MGGGQAARRGRPPGGSPARGLLAARRRRRRRGAAVPVRLSPRVGGAHGDLPRRRARRGARRRARRDARRRRGRGVRQGREAPRPRIPRRPGHRAHGGGRRHHAHPARGADGAVRLARDELLGDQDAGGAARRRAHVADDRGGRARHVRVVPGRRDRRRSRARSSTPRRANGWATSSSAEAWRPTASCAVERRSSAAREACACWVPPARELHRQRCDDRVRRRAAAGARASTTAGTSSPRAGRRSNARPERVAGSGSAPSDPPGRYSCGGATSARAVSSAASSWALLRPARALAAIP